MSSQLFVISSSFSPVSFLIPSLFLSSWSSCMRLLYLHLFLRSMAPRALSWIVYPNMAFTWMPGASALCIMWVTSRPYMINVLRVIAILLMGLGLNAGAALAAELQASCSASMNWGTHFFPVLRGGQLWALAWSHRSSAPCSWERIISDRSFRGCLVFPSV